MIDVIYREDVSEDSIHEPRNVKQIGSADPKYRIYMEDTVLTYIRKTSAAENGVHFGLLLGELKRAAGTTYLFIRGMVKAGEKKDAGTGWPEGQQMTAEAGRPEGRQMTAKEGRPEGRQMTAEAGKPTDGGRNAETGKSTGSGAVAFERLTMDRKRGTEDEEGRLVPDRKRGAEGEEGHLVPDRESGAEGEEEYSGPDGKRKMAEKDGPLTEKNVESGGECETAPTAGPLIEFDGEIWTRLYEDINRWFPDMEILGWYASFPFLNVAEFDLCREIHYTHFSGADRVLFLCDRTEREENFYRPDGAELRETEGYFTFFEKNDGMLAYQQENEPQEESNRNRSEGKAQSSLRHGTVGEAPRRKWNISAASVVITAALLAAVLFVNQYNSRLKTDGTGTSDETADGETSSIQALAVDGQVIDSISDSEAGESEDTGSEGAGEESTGSTGTDDGSAGSEGTGEESTGIAAEAGSADSEGAGDGNTGSAEAGGRTETDDGEAGTETGESVSEENGTTGSSEKNGSAGSENGETESGNASGNGDSGEAEETVQTGSRVSARYYTVQNGETLYSICMDVYKTSAMVEIVRVLNGIGEDYVIQAGQKILLP